MKESLGIPVHHQVVGTVANLRPMKGLSYLIEAARLVLDKHPDVTFVVVGRELVKGYLQELEQEAERLGIRERLLFTGFRQDALQVISAFDIFTLPSLWEGFGIVLLEAMALSKPLVGTNVGGIPEVIDDGRNGFLVEPRNPGQLAQKLLELLNNETMRHQMGQNSAITVREKFSIQETVKATEQVYVTVTNRKRSS
jgi:glycosyltransferase involved in cell wall biosynthesis